MNKKFVKPKAGLVVRRPDTGQPLPADGAEVNWNSYWARREAEGSVTHSKAKPAKAKPVKATTKQQDQETDS